MNAEREQRCCLCPAPAAHAPGWRGIPLCSACLEECCARTGSQPPPHTQPRPHGATLHTIAALLLGAFALLWPVDPAPAQSAPFVYPRTVGTSSTAVLPANTARKRLFFHNPSGTATTAVCPVKSRVDGSAVACTVGGPGSITLLPYARATLDPPARTLRPAW
jgi:hypothetical protein